MTILGIHPGALGDLVLFGQFLEAVHAKRGGCVRLVAGGEKGELLAGLGVVDESLNFDALPMQQVFSDEPPARWGLARRLGRCDLLVSCFGAGDDRAQRRLVEFTSARESLFLPVRPPPGYAGHLLEAWAELAGLDGIGPPGWSVPEDWRRRGQAALRAAGVDSDRPYVLIHPGAGGRAKCWPLEKFVELARAISSLRAAAPGAVFVMGPTELDWWPEQPMAALRSEFAVLICPPLPVLAGVAAGAEAYVGNDSGPTHLATALARPVVAVFARTDPVRFAPRGRRVIVLGGCDMANVCVRAVLAAMETI